VIRCARPPRETTAGRSPIWPKAGGRTKREAHTWPRAVVPGRGPDRPGKLATPTRSSPAASSRSRTRNRVDAGTSATCARHDSEDLRRDCGPVRGSWRSRPDGPDRTEHCGRSPRRHHTDRPHRQEDRERCQCAGTALPGCRRDDDGPSAARTISSRSGVTSPMCATSEARGPGRAGARRLLSAGRAPRPPCGHRPEQVPASGSIQNRRPCHRGVRRRCGGFLIRAATPR